ncbi:MAG: hypothetical protein WC365_02635 [Candidatus Babeliales bacterium]
MQIKTLNLLVGLTIAILTSSTLYPMLDSNSMEGNQFFPLSPLTASDESMSPLLTDEKPVCIDASTQTEESQPQNRIESSLEPCISFLGGKYAFMPVDDLSSNTGKFRVFAYDLWNSVRGKEYPFFKRLIISLKNSSESNTSFSILCLDGDPNSITNATLFYRITDVVLQKAHPLLTTLIRQLLANELIRILLLINPQNCMSALCTQPLFLENRVLSYFSSSDILLLKCLHIYHLGCAKVPLTPKDEYRCPHCKIAIKFEDDFVLYQQQV